MNGYWKIRFDLLDASSTCVNFLEEISTICDRAIFYYHPHGKTDGKSPHIHGLLVNYKKTDDTIRKIIKQRFNITSVAGCSISNTFSRGIKMSEMTYPKYMTYMSKGIYDPIYSKGFEPEEFTMAKMCWSEPKKDDSKTTIVIEPKEKVVKKMTQFQCAQEVEIRYIMEYQDEEFRIEPLIEITSKVLQENKTLSHYRIVANIIQDIQSRRNKTAFESAVKKLLNF